MRRGFLSVFCLILFLLGLPSCERHSDSNDAQKILLDYLTFLNQGRYEQAAELYGGAYDILTDWNPDLESDKPAALLERGCTINGLQCQPVASIMARPDSAPGKFRFDVVFSDTDDSRVELSSQDAESAEAGSGTSFPFTVVATDSGFKVMELPVYVP